MPDPAPDDTRPPAPDPSTRSAEFALDGEDRGAVLAGKYKLVERIGEGGMGSVWLAQQTEPVRRPVAVKVIKAGMDTRQVLARFEAERQALALMDHPNIARILDGGVTAAGRPFFVMELVRGVPINRYCDDRRLTPRQRLELFVPVCQAIQHAHQKGVIHRDVKPSNVLVATYDDRPVPKVIDFGVAKAVGPALTDLSLHTGLGGVVGTPQYMSPEQATLDNPDIDTRSDVYSLGVLLYELLAGSPPFKKRELEQAGFLEILRVIREEEPPRPSTKLSTADALPSISANRSTEPRKLAGLLRNELDWIVMKALEKDRARRYETANGFAADVLRYLAGEPVRAHPPGAAYRFRKFLRKNRGPAVAATLVFAALVAGIVGTTLGLLEARKQERVARGETEAKESARQAEAERAEGERSAKEAAETAVRAERVAKQDAQAQRANAVAAAAAEREAGDRLKKSNGVLVRIFRDLDIKETSEGGLPLEALLAKRLVAAAKELEGQSVGRPLEVAELQSWLARALVTLGNAKQAVPLYEKCLATQTEALGRDAVPTIATMGNLALAYRDAGQSAKVLPLFEEAWKLLKATRGEEAPVTLKLAKNMALSYQQEGRHGEAVAIFEKVARAYERDFGPKSLDTLWAQAELAGGYHQAGDYAKAIPLYESAVGRLKATVGPNHFGTLTTMGNLALCYRGAKRRDKALPLSKEVYERDRAVRGPNHPSTLASMGNYALDLRDAGELQAARPLAEEAVDRAAQVHGKDSPLLVSPRTVLAGIRSAAGDHDGAVTLYTQAHDAARAERGPTHVLTLATGRMLGEGLMAANRPEAARVLLEKVAALAAQHLGADHVETLSATNELAKCLAREGKYDAAEALFADLAKRYAARFGPGHPDTLTTANNRADAFKQAGKWDRATAVTAESLAAARKSLGDDHYVTILTRSNLAFAYKAVGNAAAAVPLAETNLATLRRTSGTEHKDTLATMGFLADCYQAVNRPDKALPLCEESYRLSKAKYGAADPFTLDAMHLLALAYRYADKTDPALELLEDEFKLRTEKQGPDHTLTLAAASGLADTLRAKKDFARALPLALDTLKRARKLGEKAELTSAVMGYAAQCLHETGKPAEAITLFEESLKLRRTAFGPTHDATLDSLNNIALAYRDAGRADDALRTREEIVALWAARAGADATQTLDAMSYFGTAAWEYRRLDKSVPVFEDLLKRSEKALGRAAPATQRTVANLGVNYKDAGRLAEAVPLLEEAYASSRRLPQIAWVAYALLDGYARANREKDVQRLADELAAAIRKATPDGTAPRGDALAPLGLTLLTAKQYAAAEPILREGLAIRERLAPDAWNTFNMKSMLGGALLGQGKPEAAEPLLRAGYEGMRQREKTIPAQGRIRLPEAADRLIAWATAAGKPDEVRKWQAERAKDPPELAPPPRPVR